MNLLKNIKKIAIDTLLNEAEAVKNLTNYIDENFEQCIEEILKISGRVVVTGIGKSANIGQKIVSTLNSTGTPALFMHAADAIHGDLGMIQEQDIVIAISKSGNTPEIKVLVPLLKRTGAKLVGLVGNIDSYLAESSDFILNATVEKEADPNNLAPTSSTTATLAIGDALAVCLLSARNFSSEDFAKYHPGGALGKQLYLKVSDIYPNHELPVVSANSTIQEIIVEISSKRLGATAVVDDNQELLGVITDGDLRRMLSQNSDFLNKKALDIMSPNPKTINAEAYAVEALSTLREYNITQVIVTKDKKVVGFVHLHDLLKEGII
ncbi:MAG: KpsF/GutQ family sugar-phosphate isomerase [Cytophagales bacterium]|nr:KpsF/GutQ family sugar-phosphate isomerase [Cytophagales bacterium]